MRDTVSRSYRLLLLFLLLFAAILAPILSVHAAGCVSSCNLNAQTNVPGSDASVWVMQDNITSLVYRLPHLFSFANATVHTLAVLNLTLYAPSGARYVWKQWTIYGNSTWTTSSFMRTPVMIYNYTGAASFTAEFDKQFQYALTFTDPTGHPLALPPSSVTIVNNTSTITTSFYTGQWLSARVWTITSTTWENYQASPSVTTYLNLNAGPATAIVPIRAYNATVKVVDKNNNALPGAFIVTSFANATVRPFTTNTQGIVLYGRIPAGPYSAHVFYQGQDLGTWPVDASTTPIATVQTSWSPPPPTPPPPPPPPTTTPPSWPTGSTLAITKANSTSLTLTWTAVTGSSGIVHYRIIQEGTVIATVSGNVTSYTVNGLTPGTSYEYQIQAVDISGIVSSNGLFENGTTTTPQTSALSNSYLIIAGALAGLGALGTSLFLLQRRGRNRFKSNPQVSPTPSVSPATS
jgi:hypothetical protein